MTWNLVRGYLKGFRRDDSGSATVEFAIMFPLILTVFMSLFEVAMIATRSAMLERALDITMRGVRLTTGLNPSHADLKNQICTYGTVLPDCENTLLVEMTPIDIPNFNLPNHQAPCIDRDSSGPPPVHSFVHGIRNQLMLVRACYVVDPMFPVSGAGLGLTRDPSGGFQIIATSGYVAEP